MENYEEKGEEAATHADELADRGEQVDRKIEEAKRDWQAKQDDASVPGAVPEDEPDMLEAPSDQDEPADDAGQ